MNKLIGYGIAAAGLIVFALSYPAVRAGIGISAPANITDLYITIAGVILLLVGVFLAYRNKSANQPKEIPIYEGHGKNRRVVGIQRIGK